MSCLKLTNNIFVHLQKNLLNNYCT